ncbi:MAG: DUF4445 domain-containing protein [Cyclobacteriaceae bacterium]|nr:DUF4445 domain-containing protein [Cyclobacteriaceae bacterium]
MNKIEVNSEGQQEIIKCLDNELLLPVLIEAGYDVYAPCGGNGTCGKCKVWVSGEGAVTSCFYPVTQDLAIRLPDKRESKILVDQHQFTQKVSTLPGDCANLSSSPYGVAIDVGTTTMAFYLVDLITGVISETRAVGNPQAKYGGDVITRINYAVQNEGGLNKLQQVIIKAINEQFDHFVEFIGITHSDLIKVTIAGNTTMLHLLLAQNPLSIALAPFTPKFVDSQIIDAGKLNLRCHPSALVETLPCISAYVGADIVAGLASIYPDDRHKTYLFMDIGTNGELALITPGRIICCATAAGPAFEGARITHGCTAMEGAIHAFSENHAKVIGNGKATGICGSGLIDIVAHMVENKIIDAEGLLNEDFVVVPKAYAGINEDIVINQSDIREVQLAKSAIAAGVKLLLKKAGVDVMDLDAVFLAGGFGNYIDPESAMKIGLLSLQFKDKINSLGNTSGTGAFLALKSSQFAGSIDRVMKTAEHIELAEEEDFVMEFAMNMMFDPELTLI